MKPRLALCGNVFRVHDAEGAIALMAEGQLPELRQQWLQSGAAGAAEVGFGLYLPAIAAAQLKKTPALRRRWTRSSLKSGWPIWTANAFPYGGFHEKLVKEKAFLPDWTQPERLHYTCQVADLLATQMLAGGGDDLQGSLSTCPLGYGTDLVTNPTALKHLKLAEAHLAHIADELQVHLVLSLEPEPDGAFERVSDLGRWLHQHFPQSRHVGVCWDLCHSAVVDEPAAEVVQVLQDLQVRCGKVQVSAALLLQSADSEVVALLAKLADDPWFHQVRQIGGATAARWPDLPPFLQSSAYADLQNPDVVPTNVQYGIHCHVPVHRNEFLPGLQATEWKAAVDVALAAGIRDFELETYTLPVLPSAFLEQHGVVGTFVAELAACFRQISLDTDPQDP